MGETSFSLVDDNVAYLAGSALTDHTKKIAALTRVAGTKQEAKAFAYIYEALKGLGLKPVQYSPTALISIPMSAMIGIEGLAFTGEPPAMSPNTGPDGVRAKAVWVSKENWPDFKSFSRNKIVILDGIPTPKTVSALAKAHCAGAVFVNSLTMITQSNISPVWGCPSSEQFEQLPAIPVVSVTRETGGALKDCILSRPDGDVVLWTNLDTSWRAIPVLTCEIAAAAATDDYVLFSGHVDSWFHGAMDNAGANAAMLEIARVMSRQRQVMKRNLRLAFWSGHSQGRYAGSAWYADEFWQDIHEHCVAHINIDSVGAKNADVLSYAPVMAQTRDLAREYVRKYAGQSFEGTRMGRAGDQSFWGHGVPSLFITLSEQNPVGEPAENADFHQLLGGSANTGGLGRWWHTREDTFEVVDENNLLRDTRIFCACIVRFCTDLILPLKLAEEISEIVSGVDSWAKKAGEGCDLDDLQSVLNDLSCLVKEIYRLLPGAEFQKRYGAEINEMIKKLNHILVPANYVAGDKYNHDAALQQPAVPSLAVWADLGAETDAGRSCMLSITAKRRKNKMIAEFKDAVAIAKQFLRRLEENTPDR